MNAKIVGMDKMNDGAVKIYMESVEDYDNFTDIKKSDGTHYTTRIGKQCFDVYLSKSGFERYASLGFNQAVLELFYKKGIALPVVPKSYNGRFYMALDDFGMAALLLDLKNRKEG